MRDPGARTGVGTAGAAGEASEPVTAASAAEGRPVDTRFLTFFSTWSLPKAVMVGAFVAWGLWSGLRAGVDEAPPDLANPFLAIPMFFAVWTWLSRDRRRFPEAAGHYGGLALFMVWPLLLPFYALETRGWRRTMAGALFTLASWYLAFLVGVVVEIVRAGGGG